MEIPNFYPEEQEEIINTFLNNLVGCKKVKKIKKTEKVNMLRFKRLEGCYTWSCLWFNLLCK